VKNYLPYFQPAIETISPTAETKRPNDVAEPLDVKIRAIPNKDIEIPKSDKRIKTFPPFGTLYFTIPSLTLLPH
jgi:hypothetical protein